MNYLLPVIGLIENMTDYVFSIHPRDREVIGSVFAICVTSAWVGNRQDSVEARVGLVLALVANLGVVLNATDDAASWVGAFLKDNINRKMGYLLVMFVLLCVALSVLFPRVSLNHEEGNVILPLPVNPGTYPPTVLHTELTENDCKRFIRPLERMCNNTLQQFVNERNKRDKQVSDMLARFNFTFSEVVGAREQKDTWFPRCDSTNCTFLSPPWKNLSDSCPDSSVSYASACDAACKTAGANSLAQSKIASDDALAQCKAAGDNALAQSKAAGDTAIAQCKAAGDNALGQCKQALVDVLDDGTVKNKLGINHLEGLVDGIISGVWIQVIISIIIGLVVVVAWFCYRKTLWRAIVAEIRLEDA
jgi:hypothetical protein